MSLKKKRELFLFIGSFNYAHELVTKHTWAPTWAAAKNRMLRRIADEHGVDYRQVYGMFDGSKDNFIIEREDKT
jgi:phosphoserine phosphatase